MAYDEALAARVRKTLGRQAGITEKKMFGGLAFLLRGNMCVGVHKRDLIVRLDPGDTDAALAKPHARIFDLTGRPMKGWIVVGAAGLEGDAALAQWVNQARAYAGSLPPK